MFCLITFETISRGRFIRNESYYNDISAALVRRFTAAGRVSLNRPIHTEFWSSRNRALCVVNGTQCQPVQASIKSMMFCLMEDKDFIRGTEGLDLVRILRIMIIIRNVLSGTRNFLNKVLLNGTKIETRGCSHIFDKRRACSLDSTSYPWHILLPKVGVFIIL